jgi:AcrR family transcriptional regulator
LVSNNSSDFSVADAAKEAGVTTRTLFRYFPTKEKMLEGVSQWVLEITGQIPLPASADELGETVVASYRMFEENADLMRALLLSDLGRGVRSHLVSRRRKGLSETLEQSVASLPPKQAQAVKALLVHNLTAEAWWQMRDAFGVEGGASAEAVAWMVELVLKALKDGDHPFGKPSLI